jgi:hypothetical protein
MLLLLAALAEDRPAVVLPIQRDDPRPVVVHALSDRLRHAAGWRNFFGLYQPVATAWRF